MPATLERRKRPKAKPPKARKREKLFSAAPGARFSNEDAQVIGRRIEEKKLDVRKPETLVADARQKSSPLHRFFLWDDADAAEQYRLDQARHLASHLKVEIVDARGTRVVKAFHSVEIVAADGRKDRVYATVDEVRADRHLSDQVIRQAGYELRAWRGRYEAYRREFAGIFREIELLFPGDGTN